MRAAAVRGVLFLLFTGGCGGTQTPPPPTYPTPDLVRTTYGLGNGSCWLYNIVGANTQATISVQGPDMNAVVGHTVYKQSYLPGAGGLPTEDYFDTESKGEIRLMRHIEGATPDMRVSKRYDMDPNPPLFARFQIGAKNTAVLSVGQVFTVMTTPVGGSVETHEWDVLANDEAVMTPAFNGMSAGMQKAYKLQYKRASDGTAIYSIVPTFGIAQFTDFKGQRHEVCAARVCDSSGACSGADSCTSLACPP